MLAGSEREPNSILDELPSTFETAASATLSKPKPPKKRGRPKKSVIFDLTEETVDVVESSDTVPEDRTMRLRKRTDEPDEPESLAPAKRRRGRPRKNLID